jgi:hypothetical protein
MSRELEEKIESLEHRLNISDKFYNVAIRERDLAYVQIARLEKEKDQLMDILSCKKCALKAYAESKNQEFVCPSCERDEKIDRLEKRIAYLEHKMGDAYDG